MTTDTGESVTTHNVTPHNREEIVVLLFQSVWDKKKVCLIYIHCYDGDVYLNNIVTMCANLKNAKLNVWEYYFR